MYMYVISFTGNLEQISKVNKLFLVLTKIFITFFATAIINPIEEKVNSRHGK